VHVLSPTPYPPAVPVISTVVGRPIPHASTVYVTDQLSIHQPGLSFRPEWADAFSHLRSREGVGPRSGEISLRSTAAASAPQCNDCYSVTKTPQIRSIQRSQLAHFQHVPNSCLIRAIPTKPALLLSTTLQTLFARSSSLFATPNLCFQRLVDSFGKNTAGRGYWL
jgi:hypothetical protein